MNSTSGKVELELLHCPGELDVETTSGDVTLTLPADSGFRLEYDHTSGDLRNSEIPLSRRGGDYIAGDAIDPKLFCQTRDRGSRSILSFFLVFA